MQTIMHLATTISAAAAGSLIGAVWQGIVLVAGMASCLRMMPKLTAAARSVLWTAVLVLAILLPFVALLRGSSFGHAAVQNDPLRIDVRWSLVVGGIWAVLSMVRGLQLIRSAVHLRWVARRAVPVAVARVAEISDATTLRRGRSAVEICESTDVDRPSVVGFWSPRILIPPALLERLPNDELRQIVLHEMEHLRRRDDWTNLVQKVSLVLFPMNPALIWIERQLCMERELACDDHVLEATGARKAYATCLANLAEHSLLRRGASLALGAWGRRSELAKRVHRILRRPEQRMGPWQTKAAMSFLTVAMLGGAVSLARSPELVSFASQVSAPQLRAEGLNAARLQSAMFAAERQAGQPASMTLVKAVMLEPQAPTQGHRPRPRPRSAHVVNAVANVVPRGVEEISTEYAGRVVEQESTWVVMTEWHADPMQPRVVPVRVDVGRPVYAIVPLGNGWLVVQI